MLTAAQRDMRAPQAPQHPRSPWTRRPSVVLPYPATTTRRNASVFLFKRRVRPRLHAQSTQHSHARGGTRACKPRQVCLSFDPAAQVGGLSPSHPSFRRCPTKPLPPSPKCAAFWTQGSSRDQGQYFVLFWPAPVPVTLPSPSGWEPGTSSAWPGKMEPTMRGVKHEFVRIVVHPQSLTSVSEPANTKGHAPASTRKLGRIGRGMGLTGPCWASTAGRARSRASPWSPRRPAAPGGASRWRH